MNKKLTEKQKSDRKLSLNLYKEADKVKLQILKAVDVREEIKLCSQMWLLMDNANKLYGSLDNKLNE